MISFTPLLDFEYILTGQFLIEVINMDLFWSGIAQRASEHTRIERRSQFDRIFETAIRDIEEEKR